MVHQRIEDFLQYLRFEKRYSPYTILSYKKDLSQFAEFIVSEFALDDVQVLAHFHIRSWLASERDKGQSARSVNKKISTLSSFYKYLLKQGIVQKNPVAQLHALKLPERLPTFLKPEETTNLLEETSFGEGFKGFTDRLICELLYQTGMRRQELLTLKEKDIEWSLKQLRVLGKGNKERLIPVSPVLLDDLKQYISDKKSIENSDQDHLLILESGQPLYANYVYRTVKNYMQGVTTLKKKSPHVMRHTFATHLLSNGANIQAIKDLLGHSSLAATQVYTHNNIEKLKEIHQRSHPRG